MNGRFKSFAYKTEITPLLFISTCVVILIIAQLRILGLTIKAALSNPITSLRSE